MRTKVTRELDRLGVTYEVRPHSRPVYTSEEAAQERGVRPAQIVKTMLLVTPGGDYVAALIPGDRRLDLKRLKTLLGVTGLAFIRREEVTEVTGYEAGAVSPIGMGSVKTIFIDPALLEETFVTISSGHPEAGILLRSADLQRVLAATIAPISRDQTSR